jgi:hypothetical protein
VEKKKGRQEKVRRNGREEVGEKKSERKRERK